MPSPPRRDQDSRYHQPAAPEQFNFPLAPGQEPRIRASSAPKPSGLVRPYAMTGGRTRPSYELAIEALVSTAASLAKVRGQPPESYRICVLCQEVKSIAEISALLSVPLGVTRILVGDLAQAGLVVVHQTRGDDGTGGQPNVTLLEKVLSGLRRL
ncbi:DUF742 domain-containing protein [Streptomyces sp. NPDC057950]|uniref:DUF742 domain-containing protein n=1 Tax=Streptomyces sp. NPDC057950 TaxID=3346288 RepID=UPI0036EDAFD3